MTPLNDPFNPKTGEFADNIRLPGKDDTSELHESMKRWGWLKHFPAITDEHNVVLVGHRRLKVAKQLDIEPVVEKFTFGHGDEADADRLKIAIASNIGFKQMTKEDRQRISKYLYGQREWTMQQIAKALDVGTMTVQRDLDSFTSVVKPSRPKGGRPKGSGNKTDRRKAIEDRNERIVVLSDAGASPKEIASETGLVERNVHQILEHERIRREAKSDTDPAVFLSLTSQQKLTAAIRQHQHRLDVEFEQRVREEIQKRMDEIILPHWKQQVEQAKTLYEKRKALMDKETFNVIRRALHPDSRNAISDKKLGEAFDTFMKLEKYLLNEKDSPTTFGDIPSTAAEWDKMRAARKSKRTAGTVARR